MSKNERRNFLRIYVQIKGTLIVADQLKVPVEILDISLGGMKIRTNGHLPIGAHISMDVDFPNRRTYRVTGRVIGPNANRSKCYHIAFLPATTDYLAGRIHEAA